MTKVLVQAGTRPTRLFAVSRRGATLRVELDEGDARNRLASQEHVSSIRAVFKGSEFRLVLVEEGECEHLDGMPDRTFADQDEAVSRAIAWNKRHADRPVVVVQLGRPIAKPASRIAIDGASGIEEFVTFRPVRVVWPELATN